MLVRRLEDNGVRTSLVRRVHRPTTLAFVNLEPGKDPEYIFYMEGTADRSLTPDELPSSLPGACNCLLVGSISLALEPSASTLTGFAERASGEVVVSFDPNIRDSVIPDRESYLGRFRRILGFATVVKLSDADLSWLAPGEDAESAALACFRLAAAGRPADRPLILAATLGPRGAVAFRGTAEAPERIEAPGFRIELADTIGAGDTFHAGLLAWLERRSLLSSRALANLDAEKLREALRYANACAALACTRRGAEPPDASEVERFLGVRA